MPVHLKPLPLVFQVRCLSTKISAEAHSATLARVFSGRFFARSSRDKKRAKRGCFANCWAIKGEALARHIVPIAKKMKPGISGTTRETSVSGRVRVGVDVRGFHQVDT